AEPVPEPSSAAPPTSSAQIARLLSASALPTVAPPCLSPRLGAGSVTSRAESYEVQIANPWYDGLQIRDTSFCMIQVRHHIQRRAYLLAGQGTAILPAGWPDRIALGMGLALAAYSLLALQDATVKWLVATVPVWQVLFVRAAILVAFCLATGGRPL